MDGRDGRDGRDGLPGPRGLSGSDGLKGQMGDTGAPGPQGLPGPRSGGVTFVRWGRTTCPNTTGTELVYTGRTAGSLFHQYYKYNSWIPTLIVIGGGGSNYQCIVEDPDNFDFGAGTETASYIYGVEYRMLGNVPSSSLPLNAHNVPCAVCYVADREAILMIPGNYICPQNWTREYYGYLMAEHHTRQRSTFECIDVDPETEESGSESEDGAHFYHVEPRCGSLPCPPYEEEKEMTCAVCTR